MEHDLLGERELPDTDYYGVQTLRGMENFPLSEIPLRHFQHFVRALAFVKKAAAAANSELGSIGLVTALNPVLATKRVPP